LLFQLLQSRIDDPHGDTPCAPVLSGAPFRSSGRQ
jgi:hypothetical protein